MRKMLALYATLLAGTHMVSDYIKPFQMEGDFDEPIVVPIQWGGYGYGGPYYYGPNPYYQRRGDGFSYNRRGYETPFSGEMGEGGMRQMQRWRYQNQYYGGRYGYGGGWNW
jgi:hypothetical protein